MSDLTERIDCLEWKRRLKKTPRQYKREKTEYNGVLYDCKEEARFAKSLDLFMGNIKEIKQWKAQSKIELRPAMFGKLMRTHKVDFKIILKNGHHEKIIFIEIKKIMKKKGSKKEDEAGRVRREWAECNLGIPIYVCGTAKEAESVLMRELDKFRKEIKS